MQRVYVDFETSSDCDLLKSNASVYSNHPSTEILCAVFISEDGKVLEVIDFKKSRPLVEHMIKDSLLVAHNSIFEQLMWVNILVKKFGYAPVPISSWRCTRAKLQAHSLPASLEKGAEALNLLQQKDMGGKKLMLKMCKPGWIHSEESMDSLVAYCKQDVITTMAVDKALPDLSEFEQKVWEFDQEINHRGVRADKPLIQEIISLVEEEKQRLTERFEYLVQGQVSSARSSVGLTKYLQNQDFDIKSIDAKQVSKLLAAKGLPDAIREILEIRKTLSKSSTAKYGKILASMDADDRVRESLVYHGASTGRWTGQGAQFHNLPRPVKGFDVDYALGSLDSADISWPSEYGSVNNTASSLVRSVLIPSEKQVFIGGDYAGIEARITPWIAGQESTLDVFRRNEDIYLKEASNIYGRAVTEDDKEERQVGKCAVLGLGYQGGIAAFHKMCTIYSVSLAPIAEQIIRRATADELDKAAFVYSGYLKDALKAEAEHFNKDEGMCADIIKQRWRANNPKIVEFWTEINRTAIRAVKIPESAHGHERLPTKYNILWTVEGDFLYCILPSGRKMAYYKPKVESLTNKFGVTKETLTYLGIDPKTKQLVRERTYGGKLTENIVQAVARDVMVEGMFNIKNYGLDIALTVHDEILSEGKETTNLEEVKECFIRPITWAPGLPLDAEVWLGKRYRK
jgi:DNA polymerase